MKTIDDKLDDILALLGNYSLETGKQLKAINHKLDHIALKYNNLELRVQKIEDILGISDNDDGVSN